MPLPFLALGGGAAASGISAAEITAILSAAAAAGGLAYLKIRPPAGGLKMTVPKVDELPGAVKVPEPNEPLVNAKLHGAEPAGAKPELKNPEAEMKNLPEKVQAAGSRPEAPKPQPQNSYEKVRNAVMKELSDLGVKSKINIEDTELRGNTIGMTVPDRTDAPKSILIDYKKITNWAGAAKDEVLKLVSRHEATHAAIRDSNGYITGFGKFQQEAKQMFIKPENKYLNEMFTDMLTTNKYQSNMKLLEISKRTNGPFTMTNKLINNLRQEAARTGNAAIQSFANSVQKFADAAKSAGKVLPAVVPVASAKATTAPAAKASAAAKGRR